MSTSRCGNIKYLLRKQKHFIRPSEVVHLGIIKITYNRTAQPRCYHNRILWTDRFMNLGDEVILTLL